MTIKQSDQGRYPSLGLSLKRILFLIFEYILSRLSPKEYLFGNVMPLIDSWNVNQIPYCLVWISSITFASFLSRATLLRLGVWDRAVTHDCVRLCVSTPFEWVSEWELSDLWVTLILLRYTAYWANTHRPWPFFISLSRSLDVLQQNIICPLNLTRNAPITTQMRN